MALVNVNAALLITDAGAKENLVRETINLLHDMKHCEELSENIARLGKHGQQKKL